MRIVRRTQRKQRSVPGRNWGALEVPACYVSMLLARKATTVVPKRYRHLSKVSKRCPARTVGHPKVIKGARHVPGPIRELTSLILHDHGPCTAPLTRS